MDALSLKSSVSGSIPSLSLTDNAQCEPYPLSLQVSMMAATNLFRIFEKWYKNLIKNKKFMNFKKCSSIFMATLFYNLEEISFYQIDQTSIWLIFCL